jgi:F-type H+-transporting ATPase subunit b
MSEAAKQKAAAEERFKQQELRLANLEKEIATMQAASKAEAEQEKARQLAAAEERAGRVQADTKFQLDQLVKSAEIRFREEVAHAAVKIAEEILRKQVGASDEQRLVQGFVADLGAKRPDGGGAPRPASRDEVNG